MIAVSIFSHSKANDVIVWEEGDLSIEGVSSDDQVKESDFSHIMDSILEIDTTKLRYNEWYQFTFKRHYEDDGSGSKNRLWFELIESLIVTNTG